MQSTSVSACTPTHHEVSMAILAGETGGVSTTPKAPRLGSRGGEARSAIAHITTPRIRTTMVSRNESGVT